jgi:putative ABC transport system substrate-binding protein
MPWLIIALVVVINLMPLEARAEKNIGILMFSEETRYQEATKAIMEYLKKNGYAEPAAKYTVANAGANKGKAAELVKTFAAAKYDLIFSMGTSITLAAAREIKDVPIVFSIVYDPVEAGIARDWKSSGNNTTGISSQVPITKLLDTLKDFVTVKKLAVLYTPGEKNSESILKDLMEVQANYKIKIVPVPLTKKEEIMRTLPDVIRMTDALYVTGSNLVDSEILTVVDVATKAKVVTISHLEDLIKKGVLLGVSASSYQSGLMAADKGVKILKGAKPASLPIETVKKPDVVINMKTVKKGQFKVPPEFMKTVTKVFE